MAFVELTQKDCKALDQLATRVERAATWADCGSLLSLGLRSMVDAEFCLYNETNPTGSEFLVQHCSDHENEHEKHLPAFYRNLGDHAVVKNLGFTGLFAGHAAQLSDFTSMRQYRDTGLFSEYYRHIGVDQQILVGLGVFGGIPVISCAHRVGMDFTERERQILTALRLKIAPILQRKAEETIIRKQLNKLTSKLELHTGLTGLGELTVSEVRVAEQMLQGRSYSEIATVVNRSSRTIEKQAASLLNRIGLERRTQLEALFAAIRKNT